MPASTSPSDRANSAFDGVERPRARYTLELVFTSRFELDAGATHEIDDSSRDEDLTILGQRDDTSADTYGQTPDVITSEFYFAGVKTDAYVDPELASTFTYGAPALDGAGGAVKRG